MNSQDVLSYVDSQPSIVREVFSSIVNSKSSATQKAAAESARNLVAKFVDSVADDPMTGIQSMTVEDLIVFAEDASVKIQESVKYKLLIKPVKGFWVRLMCFLYDLNSDRVLKLMRESDAQYYQLGDAIFLAGVYLILSR